MKQEIADLWISELESGRRNQTSGHLKMEWAGMATDNGDLGWTSLVGLNDSEGYTFVQIANTIRENVEDL